MTENDYNYNIRDDGSYSEDNGNTKYYYLECEQIYFQEAGVTMPKASLLVALGILMLNLFSC